MCLITGNDILQVLELYSNFVELYSNFDELYSNFVAIMFISFHH